MVNQVPDKISNIHEFKYRSEMSPLQLKTLLQCKRIKKMPIIVTVPTTLFFPPMYVCMYVHIYIYTHTHTRYIYIYIFIYMCVCIYICIMYGCMYVFVYVCVCMWGEAQKWLQHTQYKIKQRLVFHITESTVSPLRDCCINISIYCINVSKRQLCHAKYISCPSHKWGWKITQRRQLYEYPKWVKNYK